MTDFETSEDRETFRALCQEVEIDFDRAGKSPEDLFTQIARATRTRYVATVTIPVGSEPAVEINSLPPHGPKVIPVLLFSELHKQFRWWIRDGIVFYSPKS